MRTTKVNIRGAPSIPGQPTLFDLLVIAALASGGQPDLIELIQAMVTEPSVSEPSSVPAHPNIGSHDPRPAGC